MSDFPSPPSPDADSPRSPGLPSRRAAGDTPRRQAEDVGEKLSLEEMMERLQRSGESRSGRRRRSSSSSASSSSSRDAQPAPPDERSTPPRETSLLSKAVLPPPRSGEGDRATSKKRIPRQAAQRRRRRWMYALLSLIFLAGATWFGIRLLNRWRIEGEGFRVNAARRVSELADRRVTFSRFQQTGPDQLGNASLTVSPTFQDLLSSATFTNLTSQLAAGSLMSEDWTLRSLRFQKADLAFDPAKKMDAATMWQTGPAPVDRGVPSQSNGFRLGLTSEPAAIVLESGYFDELNLTWPGPEGKPESLTQLEGNFHLAGPALRVEMSGGLLDTASWPPFPVHQINAKLQGSTLEIVSARLGFTAGHEIRVTGSAELVPAGRLQLSGDIAPILLKHLLPENWSTNVLGSFETTGSQWLSHFQSGPPPTLSGPFLVRGAVLRGLPFVEKIATLLRKPELALMEFPTFSGQFIWTPQTTRISAISAITKDGLLRLKGDLTVTPEGNLGGQLVFEANDAYFAGLPSLEPQLFSPSAEGWRTLIVSFGGGDKPVTDNIPAPQPAAAQNRPAAVPPAPRLSLPDEVSPPPATAPRPAPRQPVPASPRPTRPLSEAELEKQFNEIIGR